MSTFNNTTEDDDSIDNQNSDIASVQFDNVRKVYDGQFVAIEDFSAKLEDGEFITIVGPSGSGKSTLLRMVAGLESITEGTISIGGKKVNGVEPQHRGIAMVFQNYALYPHKTVRENMSYGLKLTTDMSAEEISQVVEETAQMMGIEEHLDDRPGSLSGGQQQRVATGRAIVRDPLLFLMDEPLSNLDAKLKVHMRTELQRIQNELNTTTIYVTHDQHEALTMSDRIIVLDAGELQQFATPDEVYQQPANRFVAGFIGEPAMNFFNVELSGSTLIANGFECQLPEGIAEQVEKNRTGSELELGIRPEDIEFAEGQGSIEATVEVVENAGSDNYLYLNVNGTECTVRVPTGVNPTVGEVATLNFDPSDIHVFDVATGKNLLLEKPGHQNGSEVKQSAPTSGQKQ